MRLRRKLPMSERSVADLDAAGCLDKWKALAFLGLLTTPTLKTAARMALQTTGSERLCWIRLSYKK